MKVLSLFLIVACLQFVRIHCYAEIAANAQHNFPHQVSEHEVEVDHHHEEAHSHNHRHSPEEPEHEHSHFHVSSGEYNLLIVTGSMLLPLNEGTDLLAIERQNLNAYHYVFEIFRPPIA